MKRKLLDSDDFEPAPIAARQNLTVVTYALSDECLTQR